MKVISTHLGENMNELENKTLSVTEAIQSRRTIFNFKLKKPAREEIEEVLAFGIWAPNHRLTEPWRFTIIGEKKKLILAGRYREIQIEKVIEHANEQQQTSVGQKGYDKFMSKPVIVAVSYIKSGNNFEQREDYAATCCAIQNIQLAAWSHGIGMQWSTGPITREKETHTLIGINYEEEEIIGFLYTGYPAEIPKARRKLFSELFRVTA